MLNYAVVMGRLVRDVELRQINGDINKTSFSLAVDRDFKNKQTGEKETDWVDVTAIGKRADFIAKHFHKGDAMIVSGRLRYEQWTDKEGNKRSKLLLDAQDIFFAGGKSDNSGAPKASTKPKRGSNDSDDEEEMPF